jgi:hypothetical protein
MTIVYAVVPSVIGVMGIATSIYMYKRHLDNKNALSKIAEAAEFDPKK